MADLRTLVEREMDRAGTPTSSFVDLERRRGRLHRNRRIVAGVIGTVIGLAAILTGMSVIRSSPAPANMPTPASTRARLSFVLDDGRVVSENLRTGSLLTVADLGHIWGLAWSPDGRQIAFEGVRGGVCRLVVLTISSGSSRDLASCDGSPSAYGSSLDWSTDGRWIAFLGEPDGIRDQIVMVHPDGTGLHPITDPTGFPIVATGLSLSPDGSRIAFGSGRQIYTVDADGSNRRFVTNGFWPDWSSDGSVIALLRDPRGHGPSTSGDPFVAQLWTVRPDGSAPALVHRWPGCCIGGVLTGPSLSPDGSLIALVVLSKIRVVSINGRHDRAIETPASWVEATLSWHPLPSDATST